MNRLWLALGVLFLFSANHALADRVLSRKKSRVYVEADQRLANSRAVDVYHRGKRLGRFKVLKYLEKHDVLVLRDRKRKLRADLDVSLRPAKNVRRKTASERKYPVFEKRRGFRGTEMDFGVYAGTGAVGPLSSGEFIDQVDLGYSFGAFVLYKLNRKWDLKVAAQYSNTSGSGSSQSTMGVDGIAGLGIGIDADFDYKIKGSVQTLKIPVTANYNYNRNWVFRVGGYVDFIMGAKYKGTVQVTSIKAGALGTIDAFNFKENELDQDIKQFMNTTSLGVTTGASYVLGRWRFNVDAGYSFNQAFKSNIVIDSIDVGELDLFGFASVPIKQNGIELEKPDTHSGFGQVTVSYTF